MIILPVKISDKNNGIAVPNKTFAYGNTSLPYANDRFELSFTGFFEESAEPVRLDQAQNVSGIHCPACGGRMLSEKEYQKILNKAGEISNAQGFIELLKENQKYLPMHMRRIILDSEWIKDPSATDIVTYHNSMSVGSYLAKKAVVHKVRDELKEYTQTLGLHPDKLQKADEIVDKIHTTQDYLKYKGIIDEYINFLNLSNDDANFIKMRTLRPVVLANDYYRIFHTLKPSKMSEQEVAVTLARNIFSKSIARIVPMDKYPYHEGLPNNQVLICDNCTHTQSKNNFTHNLGDPKLKGYIDTYLADIAYLIGHNKMKDSKDYITAFCLNIGKITKGQVQFTKEEIKSLRNLQYSASRHEIFAPIQQSKVDIPCAECGSTLITYEMRKHIEDEMKDCKTLSDYVNLLHKYDKYIGRYARPYADMFTGLVEHEPDMSPEEFVKRFKRKADKYEHRKLVIAYEEYKTHRDYYLKEGTPEQLKNYDLFRLYVSQYINSKSYLDDELQTYYNKCIKSLNLEQAPVKAIYAFNTAIKQIIFAHRITTNENLLIGKPEDPVFTIVFNIFKTSIATADHLHANSKGGSDTKDNLIGLCKTCNRIKSKKDVRTWIIDNNRIKRNIERQMHIVDGMAKSGQIDGFDSWAKDISQTLYELSEGKIDLREQFAQ